MCEGFAGIGGPVGMAAASHTECSEVDEFFWVLSVGFLNDHCDSSKLSQHATDLEDAQANATKTDIHSTGQQTKANTEQYLGVFGNYLQDSQTPAMAKAEAAAVEAIDNGDSETEVEQAAVDAVQDYYTKKQLNLIDQYGVTAETIATMGAAAEANGDIDPLFVSPELINTNDETIQNVVVNGTETETITLINGTQRAAKTIRLESQSCTEESGVNSPGVVYMGVRDGSDQIGTQDCTSNDRGTVVDVRVDAFDDQLGFAAIEFSDYSNEWSDITSKSNQMETNAEQYADALYNETQNGSADVSDYVSGATLAQEYSTDYNDTGFYSYLVGFSATQGMAIPNLSTTSLMEIQTVDSTYQGLIMSQYAPNGSEWEVGTTYNADNIQGKQFVATTDGEVVELDGQFTIQSMEDQDGNEVESTSIQEFNYTVTNETSNYAELQEEIRALQEEINNIEPPGGSGGGGDGGFDFNLGTSGVVVIAAAASAVLLLGRN
jgi:hypothetical protein